VDELAHLKELIYPPKSTYCACRIVVTLIGEGKRLRVDGWMLQCNYWGWLVCRLVYTLSYNTVQREKRTAEDRVCVALPTCTIGYWRWFVCGFVVLNYPQKCTKSVLGWRKKAKVVVHSTQ
jgi:hypothetical protein